MNNDDVLFRPYLPAKKHFDWGPSATPEDYRIPDGVSPSIDGFTYPQTSCKTSSLKELIKAEEARKQKAAEQIPFGVSLSSMASAFESVTGSTISEEHVAALLEIFLLAKKFSK